MVLALVDGELAAFVVELGLLEADVGLSSVSVVIIGEKLKDLSLRGIMDTHDHLCMLIRLVYWHILLK